MHVREFIERNYPEYYSIERYPAERTAPFCKVDAPWGIFSNFGRTPLVIDGVAFDYNYPAGLEYIYAGGGLEYFPLGNRNLRVHFFLMTDNLQKALCTQAGLTWRFHIIDKP